MRQQYHDKKRRGRHPFADTGYACYRDEMLKLIRQLVPEFHGIKKTALITHADVDHCGLLPDFDEVLMSERSLGKPDAAGEHRSAFREQNELHAPYIRIRQAADRLHAA